MKLSPAQRFALRYLAGADRATLKRLRLETGARTQTVSALRRRGLVRYDHSPTGVGRVEITDAGRRAVAEIPSRHAAPTVLS